MWTWLKILQYPFYFGITGFFGWYLTRKEKWYPLFWGWITIDLIQACFFRLYPWSLVLLPTIIVLVIRLFKPVVWLKNKFVNHWRNL